MTEQLTISNMIRSNADDTVIFYTRIANHIEELESTIKILRDRIVEQDKIINADIDDFK